MVFVAEKTVVLHDDDLDLLEAALSGFTAQLLIPTPQLGSDGADAVIFADPENTPVARWDGVTLSPLRPFAAAVGSQWNPAVRRSAASVAETLSGHDPLGIVITDLPTREDVETASALTRDTDSIILLVPASRRPVIEQVETSPEDKPASDATPAKVGAASLVRAAQALAEQLSEDSQQAVEVLVVPWPLSPPPGLTWDNVAASLGIERVVRLTDLRSTQLNERIEHLDHVWEDEVHSIYPDASARELLTHGHLVAGAGIVVLFTGLSGSGKSTIAKALVAQLNDDGIVTTLLDGDEVRQHLSRGLGFDRESREINLDRIGYVAALVAQHGGVSVAAPIAPFAASRAHIRELATSMGNRFVLVYVSTPLEVCEARDRKGLYAQARAGLVPEFTGISSPFEEPTDADLVIDASVVSIEDAVAQVTNLLGY